MCGIAGEVRFDGRSADLSVVERMSEAQARRGPDGSGRWAEGPVALAHRRLSVIDLSERGSQPMVDDDLGLSIVFNGCVYNYPALRSELAAAGHAFRSTSDTEVVLKGYAQWGTDVVHHLVGMFAFAIVDRRTGRLVLARDRLGIKPLYYSETPGRLRFASTLPALVAAGDVDTSIDDVALHHYLSWHAVVPAPRTILNGVRKLPPATVRVYESDGSSTDTLYWQPAYERRAEHEGMDADDWRDAIGASLRRAVERRLVADVPVGVLLSGGLDSSLVVALLSEAGQHGLRTFSIGFESTADEAGDEFQYSDAVAAHYDTVHTKIRIAGDRLLPGVDAAVAAMSEPMVSHDVVGFYLLSQEVSQHVKVVQSGQGADEVFAGYHWYPPLRDVPREQALDVYAGAFFDRDSAAMAQVLSPEHLPGSDVSRELVAAHLAAPGAQTALDAALRLDSHVMLVDDPVKRVDNMTMAWGLEARVPFLDADLVELAAACPPELKLAQGGKGPLKDVARSVLPAEVIDRPKGYFPVPALKRLHGPLLGRVMDALRAPEATGRGLFRPEYVEALAQRPNDELTPLRGNKLWQLGLLEMWLQAHGIR
jgi:asparagine synthase (glutamine-hydrolysing)